MRVIISATFVLGLLAVPAVVSSANADSMKNCAATWKGMSAADKAKTTYKAFSSSCLKGGTASAPAAAAPARAAMAAPAKPTAAMAAPTAMAAVGSVPAGATGQCKDGTY